MAVNSLANALSGKEGGSNVYLTDSDYVNLTLDDSTPVNPVGWMSRYMSATDVDVTLFTPTQFLCQVGSVGS